MQSPPPPPPPSGGMMPPPPPPMGGYQPAPGYAPSANYGGFWIRVVAYVIDVIILAVVAAIVDAIFRVNPANPGQGAYTIATLLHLLIDIAYFSYMWSQQGG